MNAQDTQGHEHMEVEIIGVHFIDGLPQYALWFLNNSLLFYMKIHSLPPGFPKV